MIVPKYFEDLNVLHKNTMPDRAYYIPASVPMDLQPETREASDRFQLLSGDWKFRYFENIYDIVKIRNPTVKLFHFGRMHHEF